MRKITLCHRSNGGTAITNFDPADEPLYLATILAYGDESLVIHDEAYKPCLPGSKSLHCLTDEEKLDLSAFWRMYERLSKHPAFSDCPYVKIRVSAAPATEGSQS